MNPACHSIKKVAESRKEREKVRGGLKIFAPEISQAPLLPP